MQRPFSNFDEARLWLDSHIDYEAQLIPRDEKSEPPSLDGIRELLDVVGNPEASTPVIHITGTNGKTTTSRIITRMLNEYGLTTGLFTSPHLQRLNERWRINFEPASDEALTEVFSILANAEFLIKEKVTFFDLITAAAFVLFSDAAVDVAVIEVGMGGIWDSTNVADGDVSVITNVSLDHVEQLGPTRAHIAREKAGIIKEKSVVILGETDPELRDIFLERKAAEFLIYGEDFETRSKELAVGGRLLDVSIKGQEFDELYLSLHGAHQGANATIALAAVRAFFDRDLEEDIVRNVLGSVDSPGRLEVVSQEPLVLIDGAHNIAGADSLVSSLQDEFNVDENLILIFGMLKGHDPSDFLTELGDLKPKAIVVTQVDSPRAYEANELAELVSKHFDTSELHVIPRVSDAIEYAQSLAFDDDVIVICGSIYAVGEAREQFLPSRPFISE